MALLRAHQAQELKKPVTSYAPIAHRLFKMEKGFEERICRKFDICYMIAKENLAFGKYPAIHNLETRHGVSLGTSYSNKARAAEFVHFIAESQRQQFVEFITSSCHFYSFLMDGSTDAGVVDNEVIAVL
jgi:hypothetical protein